MARWFHKVTADPAVYPTLAQALLYFFNEYDKSGEDIRPPRGTKLWDVSVKLPGVMEYRFGQLQEIEALLKLLEIRYDKLYTEKKRHFLENYNRNVSDRQASEMANVEQDVIEVREFIQQTALIRNLYLGLIKGLETLHYQMGHLVNLRRAQIEDATF
jgi:hypothetical protein